MELNEKSKVKVSTCLFLPKNVEQDCAFFLTLFHGQVSYFGLVYKGLNEKQTNNGSALAKRKGCKTENISLRIWYLNIVVRCHEYFEAIAAVTASI